MVKFNLISKTKFRKITVKYLIFHYKRNIPTLKGIAVHCISKIVIIPPHQNCVTSEKL